MTTQGLIDNRFEVRELLGQGAQARTYRGLDRKTGRAVAIKELLLHHVDSWKAVELFEREGQILHRLNHPAIPGYVATLHLEEEVGRERFFLVQELVDGEDLKHLFDRGFRLDENQARQFLAYLLEVLVYLQSLSPVVIHRDIKPSNILRRPDGSFALIDFGAVQAVMPSQGGGSTVVGTSGYMPVEQLMGRADTSTDLYSLAATTVQLLSGRHPNDLPMEDLRLRFEEAVNISPALKGFLTRMLAPEANRRFRTAQEALKALQNIDNPTPVSPAPPNPQPHFRPRDLVILFALILFIFGAPLVLLVFQDSSSQSGEEVPMSAQRSPDTENPQELATGTESEPEPEHLEPEPEYPEFTATPPAHIGPLRLGMTREEARDVVPDDRSWRRRGRGRPMPPGETWLLQTEFLGHPMECSTHFCEERGICSLFCTIRREFPVEEYRQLTEALVDHYREAYGSETRYAFTGGNQEQVFWWTHPDAEFYLRAQSTELEYITGTHGHSTKRLFLESAYYRAWHEENKR